MLNNLINELTILGYKFNHNGYCIEIFFKNHQVIIWETIQETYYLKILNNKKEKIFKKTYKTVNGVLKYGLNKTYLK